MITRNTVASQLRDYLQHRTTRASLVDWAERAMMEEESFQGIADAFYSLAGLATCTSERLLSTTGGLINGSFASQLRVIDSAAYALFDFAFQRLRLPFDLVSIHDSTSEVVSSSTHADWRDSCSSRGVWRPRRILTNL